MKGETLEQQLARFTRDLAEVRFSVWAITPDDKDIRSGEFPINDRISANVKGFEAAYALATSTVLADPTILGALIIPNIGGKALELFEARFFRQMRIGRGGAQGGALPNLDPTEGDGPRKGTIIL